MKQYERKILNRWSNHVNSIANSFEKRKDYVFGKEDNLWDCDDDDSNQRTETELQRAIRRW